MTRPKTTNPGNTENVVQGLPTITRTLTGFDTGADLERYALMLVLGERVNLSTLQVYWLNQAYHRCPECLSFGEWVYQLAGGDVAGELNRAFTRDVAEDLLSINNWDWSDEEWSHKLDDLMTLSRVLVEERDRIGKLLGVVGIGTDLSTDSGIYFLNLQNASWHNLVDFKLMKPITASMFMMVTRPCENVALTPTVLKWSMTVPAAMGIPQRSKIATPLPAGPPEDLGEYAKFEYYVRRQQRVYFPGRTSCECHMLINITER